MKGKLATAAIFFLVLAGITAFNMYFERKPITAAQEEESKQTEEKLAQKDAETAPAAAENTAASGSTSSDKAPDVFKAKFETSKGDFVIEVHKDWAPLGAQRFYDLVKAGFYNDNRFFRVVPDFVVQWGISNDREQNHRWEVRRIKDDPVKQSNTPGMVSFASAGPNTRTTQVFINYGSNTNLDHYQQGFPPFGKVVEGMDVVRSLESKYADAPTREQDEIANRGNAFLDENFPGLDYIKKATIVP